MSEVTDVVLDAAAVVVCVVEGELEIFELMAALVEVVELMATLVEVVELDAVMTSQSSWISRYSSSP